MKKAARFKELSVKFNKGILFTALFMFLAVPALAEDPIPLPTDDEEVIEIVDEVEEVVDIGSAPASSTPSGSFTKDSSGVVVSNVTRSSTMELQDFLEFCGISRNESCKTHKDCIMGGYSSQICGARGKKMSMSKDWKSCYDARLYYAACGCKDGKCQWFDPR